MGIKNIRDPWSTAIFLDIHIIWKINALDKLDKLLEHMYERHIKIKHFLTFLFLTSWSYDVQDAWKRNINHRKKEVLKIK